MAWASVVRNKRKFLKFALAAASAGILAPLYFSQEAKETLTLLLEDLFPDGIYEGIGAQHANARSYMSYIMHHPRVSDDEKDFMKRSLLWLDEAAEELFAQKYARLETKKRHEVLEHISKKEWGESLIETFLGYIFEAQFGDPVYGINTNESGWKWTEHTPGYPRPQRGFDG